MRECAAAGVDQDVYNVELWIGQGRWLKKVAPQLRRGNRQIGGWSHQGSTRLLA